MTILTGDCRHLMPAHGPFDLILADPPYGDTSLAWDRRDGWITRARDALSPTGSLWVFGSLRCFMATADRFADAGLRIAQEIVWEKQNGPASTPIASSACMSWPSSSIQPDAVARHLQ
jgi:site-specific DNA-methyltransferase (adenine-specific)